MTEYTTAATTDEITPDEGILVEVNGHPIALFEVDDEYYAISNTCTHRGGSLCDGMVTGTMVTCPLHGAAFDITTGDAMGPPASEPVQQYDIKVDGEEIRLAVD
jgi:nitrite reductase/ring-hydroxylating ferredoxin subunit